MPKLPKNAPIGSKHTITVNNPKLGKRSVTFQRMKKSGFGMWKILSNKKA
jgi:hypothetical protein